MRKLRQALVVLSGFIRFQVAPSLSLPTYAAYNPDANYVFRAHPEMSFLWKRWLRGNKRNNAGDFGRIYALILNIKQVLEEGVPGDFAELGVYRGNSAAILAHFARSADRHTFLFDTFAGFERKELRVFEKPRDGMFENTSVPYVKSVVGNVQDVTFIEGHFPGSLTDSLDGLSFAVVHLDCDLYEATKEGLRYFYPRLSQGGLLLIHDYSSQYWPGIKQAVDEFLLDVPERAVLMPDKSGTAVIRKLTMRVDTNGWPERHPSAIGDRASR